MLGNDFNFYNFFNCNQFFCSLLDSIFFVPRRIKNKVLSTQGLIQQWGLFNPAGSKNYTAGFQGDTLLLESRNNLTVTFLFPAIKCTINMHRTKPGFFNPGGTKQC